MSFDQTCGHQTLEPAYAQGAMSVAMAVGEWSRASSAIAIAAACPVHGCCDEEGEDLERWDGLG